MKMIILGLTMFCEIYFWMLTL